MSQLPTTAPQALRISDVIRNMVDHYRVQATQIATNTLSTTTGQPGLGAPDVAKIFGGFVATMVRILHGTGLDPVTTKPYVVAAAAELFDHIAPLISIPYVPAFVENSLIDPIARRLVTDLTGGIVDVLIKVFGSVTVPPTAPVPGANPAAPVFSNPDIANPTAMPAVGPVAPAVPSMPHMPHMAIPRSIMAFTPY